jgi:hypothetical protein
MEGDKRDSSHKGLKIFIIIFLSLSIFLLNEKNQERLITFFNSIGVKEKTLELVDSFKDKEALVSVNLYDNNIIRWNGNKLSFLKSDGSIILEKEFNFTDPFIYYGQKNIYVTDRSTGDIYYLDKNGQTIYRNQINKEIFNLKESNGYIIYHIKEAGEESITILDKDNAIIGSTSYEDKNILTYEVNKNGKKRVLSSLDFKGNVLKSQIEVYGEKNDKLSSLDIEGEIAVYLQFISKDKIIVLTDYNIYCIKEDEVLWKKQFDLIKDIYIGEDIYILYSNYLEVIDFDGNTKNKIGFTEDYGKIMDFNGKILVYGEKGMSIIEGNKEVLKHTDEIKEVGISKNNILIWNNDEIKIYRFSNK